MDGAAVLYMLFDHLNGTHPGRVIVVLVCAVPGLNSHHHPPGGLLFGSVTLAGDEPRTAHEQEHQPQHTCFTRLQHQHPGPGDVTHGLVRGSGTL